MLLLLMLVQLTCGCTFTNISLSEKCRSIAAVCEYGLCKVSFRKVENRMLILSEKNKS